MPADKPTSSSAPVAAAGCVMGAGVTCEADWDLADLEDLAEAAVEVASFFFDLDFLDALDALDALEDLDLPDVLNAVSGSIMVVVYIW